MQTWNSVQVQLGDSPLSAINDILVDERSLGEAGSSVPPMEVPMKLREIGLAGIIATTNAIPALAHHSFATFDADRRITLEGIVKDFQWTNPHSWLFLTVSDARGRLEQWTIELGAPSSLARNGWVPKQLSLE
jgi:hypothetical protein